MPAKFLQQQVGNNSLHSSDHLEDTSITGRERLMDAVHRQRLQIVYTILHDFFIGDPSDTKRREFVCRSRQIKSCDISSQLNVTGFPRMPQRNSVAAIETHFSAAASTDLAVAGQTDPNIRYEGDVSRSARTPSIQETEESSHEAGVLTTDSSERSWTANSTDGAVTCRRAASCVGPDTCKSSRCLFGGDDSSIECDTAACRAASTLDVEPPPANPRSQTESIVR
jgi:hypothetical protein